MRIAIVINSSWNIYNFRKGLVLRLIKEGHEVIAIAPKDDYSAKLVDWGCKFYDLPVSPSGMNPLQDFGLFWRLIKIFRLTRPNVCLTYTIKPNIYGSIAGGLLRIPVICNVSGLGTVFLWKGSVKKVAIALYTLGFRFSSWIFFQNEEDQKDFLNQIKIREGKTGLLPGSGVDLNYFKPGKSAENQPPHFLMISRLLVEKGIYDYVKAIKLLHEQGVKAAFTLVGALDEGHSRSISKSDLDEWITDGLLQYLPPVEDVRALIAQADVIVLPSYREGTPRTLLEGGAMGKPLIATDVPGCRQVVDDGVNGFLCKLKNPRDLAAKMRLFLSLNEEEKRNMGNQARKIVSNRFDEKLVVELYLRKIEELTNLHLN